MNDAIYFSHDANAADDEKIQAMLYDHGAAGYGLYWIIVERMRRAENDGYALSLKPYMFVAIARISGSEPTDVEDFIHECVEKYDLFRMDDEYVWSESLRRRMEIKDAKREQRGEQAKRAAEKRWNSDRTTDKDTEHADAMPEHADGMPTHSDRNAKHAKAKGKGKDKELGSSMRGKPASPPEKVPPVYHAIKAAYESQWEDETLPSYAREGPAMKKFAAEAQRRSPEDPESWAQRFCEAHLRLKNDPESLLYGHPFLPTIAMSQGLYPRILEAMNGTAGRNSELMEAIASAHGGMAL